MHVGHAFRNLDRSRRGEDVRRELVQQPREAASGPGWRLHLLGRLPEMFFDVHRIEMDAEATAPQDCGGRFHVLNLVEGNAVTIQSGAGRARRAHTLAYAETMVIPAAVGRYEVRTRAPARLVRAVVR